MHSPVARPFFLPLLLFFLFSTCVFAQALPRVAVIPFVVHGPSELAYLSEAAADMLGSRIAAKSGATVVDRSAVNSLLDAKKGLALDGGAAARIARAVGADFAVFGSITVVGDSVSVDAKAVDVSATLPSEAFYRQADSVAGIIPAIDHIASDICGKIFNVSPQPDNARQAKGAPGVSHAPAQPAGPPSAAAPGVAAAGAAFVVSAKQPSKPPAGASPFVKTGGASAPGFWKSPDLDFEVRGMAVADLDGDGKNETALISKTYLGVWRFENGAFYKVAERKAASYEKFLSVDAADTDKDGRAELFVGCTNTTNGKPCSFVLGLSNGRLAVIAEKQPWYFRAKGPDSLYGQKRGLSELFLPPVFRLEKSGDGYVESGDAGAPSDFTVFDFVWGDPSGSGETLFIAYGRDDRIRLCNRSGELVWKSTESFGGSETFIEERAEHRDDSADRFYLPQRLFAVDINGDGKEEVITVKNEDVASRVFGRYRNYGSGMFVCLGWDGLGLSELWHTRKISGYISDFALADFDNDGKAELAGAVVEGGGAFFSRPKSCVISYDIEDAF